MMMTIQNLLEIGKQKLQIFDEGNLEARILLEFVLDCDHNYLLTHRDQVVSDDCILRYEGFIEERLTQKPISQIMGEKDFYGYTYKVNENTLTPRPETEVLVDYLINKIGQEEALICDIGTGTGCIPITICSECHQVKAYALDISKEALKVARFNVLAHQLENRVTCIESDLLSKLDQSYYNSLDVVISNPPYIKSVDVDKLAYQVKGFEPRNALDGGDDGLDYYRAISKESLPYLVDGGMIIYEVGHNQSEAVSKILTENGYVDIDVIQDLYGINRIVLGILRKNKQ